MRLALKVFLTTFASRHKFKRSISEPFQTAKGECFLLRFNEPRQDGKSGRESKNVCGGEREKATKTFGTF